MNLPRTGFSKLSTRLAVIFMCCLVIFPTAKAILESQLSARYVLSALEQLEAGEFDSSRKSLETAVAWSDKIATSDELLQLQLYYWVLGGEPEKAIAEVTKAKGLERFDLANSAYTLFFSIRDFQNALTCTKVLLEHPDLSTVEKLNLTAYVRSLAKVELDQALLDIETAVKVDNSPSVVDTKAWVLHGLGRNEEALTVINDAIERAEKAIKADGLTEPSIASSSKAATDESKSEPASEGDDLTKSDAAKDVTNKAGEESVMKNMVDLRKEYTKDEKNPLKVLAVMRFHRAEILEALDRDASQDLNWLTENGFTNKDVLY
jgi:tetratricopeptide (TPR) repeat protein